jgi:hypothetical protein
MTRHARITISTLTGLILGSLATPGHAQEAPTVTPYRPGMGSPAVLSAPGYFEIEAGMERRGNEDGEARELGLLLKYGLNERWGVMLGLSPWLRVSPDAGEDITGASDLMLGVKTVARVNEDVAIGGQWLATLPTGAREFRGDGVNVTATFLVGIDSGDWHTDINLGLTRIAGDPGPGLGKLQWQWSAAISRPLSDNLSGGFELSGTHQSGADDTGLAIVSLSYNASRRLAWDVYAGREWNVDDPGWRVGAGVTYLFAK